PSPEVSRSGHGVNPVSTKSRIVEVRVIEDIEELGPEFKPEALRELEALEQRQIRTVESGASNLRWLVATQDAGGSGVQNTPGLGCRSCSHCARLGEGRSIQHCGVSIGHDVEGSPGILPG